MFQQKSVVQKKIFKKGGRHCATVSVHVPRTMKIELTPVNELRAYEAALWFGTLATSIAASFWTGLATTVRPKDYPNTLLWSAVAFTVTALACFGWAIIVRLKIKQDTVENIVKWN